MHAKVSREFLAFCAVGVIGFLVDVGILYLLSSWLGWYAGRALSFLLAATVTWFLNRLFTFSNAVDIAKYSIFQQYWRYILAMMGGALVNYLMYTLTMIWIDGAYAPLLGVALGSMAGLAVNFISARRIVFRQNSD